MKKSELIKALDAFSDDAEVLISITGEQANEVSDLTWFEPAFTPPEDIVIFGKGKKDEQCLIHLGLVVMT